MTLVTHSPSTTPTVASEAPGLPPQLGERPQGTRVGHEARKAYKAAGFYPPMLTHVLGRRGHIATQVCLVHQPSYNALKRSAVGCSATSPDYCPLCLFFSTALERKNGASRRPPAPEAFKDHKKSQIWLVSGDQAVFDLSQPNGLFSLRVNVGNSTLIKEADFNITSLPDDPLALYGDIIGRSININHAGNNNGYDEYAERITQWLRTCESEHVACRKPVVAHDSRDGCESVGLAEGDECPLPSRLLDESHCVDLGIVRLCETIGFKGRYCALSYSCGRSPSFKTTRDNYARMLAGFSINDNDIDNNNTVPTTIRDAMLLTCSLGIRYLGVDALCIIQDDKHDWAVQTARMYQVYGYATLTIAASACKDKWDDLFPRRSTQDKISIVSPCSNGLESGVMTFSARDGSFEELLDRCPLASRAWTLQERALSRRTVHITTEQMYWECERHCVSENGSTFDDIARVGSFEPRNRTSSGTSATSGDTPSSSNFKHALRRWWATVNDYAQRDLFAASDKLPALAGLARQFHRVTGSTYVAGMWLDDFPMALLWTTTIGRYKTKTGHGVEKWRGPSWSWLSIEGALNCVGHRIMPSETLTVVEQLELVSVDVAVKSPDNIFGEVTRAVLRVRGKVQRLRRRLVKAQFDYGGFLGNIELGFPVESRDEDDDFPDNEVRFDDEMDAGAQSTTSTCARNLPEEFLCILIDRRKNPGGSNQDRFAFLVIEEVGNGTFKRIGSGKVKGRSWFDLCETVNLDLV
ncbi:hypothetical protein PV08_05966 [Exophiala spinifera]|uniref:Heterokaryon incompatibility domain-containing protein n=1 Tax=Exophiala spinifera TaxID=91928 RepID=A0A0D1YLK6_9EURO|nr:uncharacterized protein PV08_05966 [Exophiala spinifera]KIW15916.1 hypothetical protein PV08_05966 [Exophiala spinifera]